MRDIEDLKWFDRKNYAITQQWQASDWLVALSGRYTNQLTIRDHLSGHPRAGMSEYLTNHFAQLSSDVKLGGSALWMCGFRLGDPWKFHVSRGTEGIRAPIEDDLPTAKGQLPPRDSSSRCIHVDMAAPDRVLIDSFARWLKAARAAGGRVQVVTDTDMNGWVACEMLPYIDIHQYLTFAGKRVTNARLADILFPFAEVDRVERLRKVTVKSASRVLNTAFLDTFAAQIGESAHSAFHGGSFTPRDTDWNVR